MISRKLKIKPKVELLSFGPIIIIIIMCASCGIVGLGFCETTMLLWNPLGARWSIESNFFDLGAYMIFPITDPNEALIGY